MQLPCCWSILNLVDSASEADRRSSMLTIINLGKYAANDFELHFFLYLIDSLVLLK